MGSAPGRGNASLAQAVGTAAGLLELVGDASLAELTSLEEVLAEWQRAKILPASLTNVLWDVLQSKRPELATPADRRGALALLNMAAIGEPALLKCKMGLLIAQVSAAKSDLALARHGCVALQRCAAAGAVEPKAAKAVTKALEKLLANAPKASESDEWYAMAEQAVGTIDRRHAVQEASVLVGALGTLVVDHLDCDGLRRRLTKRTLEDAGKEAARRVGRRREEVQLRVGVLQRDEGKECRVARPPLLPVLLVVTLRDPEGVRLLDRELAPLQAVVPLAALRDPGRGALRAAAIPVWLGISGGRERQGRGA